tara:strand:- start:110 stop:853 length:744 start_codon:yes stop_codon:yes gene_type:complete
MMIKKTCYSQNFSKKTRKFNDIKVIVIHYTGMQSKIVSIRRLLDIKKKVSCHYLIDRKGEILRMVDDNKVAWHAGKSRWKNYVNLNRNSIGIELVNKGHKYGYEKFTNVQINKLIKLCLNLKKKYKISNNNIVGHSDISPNRKQDPGEKFPWKKLNKHNLGIWYKEKMINKIQYKNFKKKKKMMKKTFFRNLRTIGYRYCKISDGSTNNPLLIKAFQRRFNPNHVSGILDEKTLKISHFLALQIKLT